MPWKNRPEERLSQQGLLFLALLASSCGGLRQLRRSGRNNRMRRSLCHRIMLAGHAGSASWSRSQPLHGNVATESLWFALCKNLPGTLLTNWPRLMEFFPPPHQQENRSTNSSPIRAAETLAVNGNRGLFEAALTGPMVVDAATPRGVVDADKRNAKSVVELGSPSPSKTNVTVKPADDCSFACVCGHRRVSTARNLRWARLTTNTHT